MAGSKSEQVSIRLLGSFEVEVGPATLTDDRLRRRRKSSWLIKLLALAPDHALHREQVFDTLWPELAPEAARNELYKALHFLRSALREQGCKDDIVALHGPLVELAKTVCVDVEDFRRAAESLDDDPARCEAALALYRGPLLPREHYEPWTEALREELRGLRERLLRELVRAYGVRGRWTRAAEFLRSLPEDDLDEELARTRMRVYHRAGDQAGAITAYERCTAALRRELGVEPSRESVTLYRSITTTETKATPAVPASAALTALVGRSREVALLRKALADARSGSGGIVLMSGEPGIGKSRLLLELIEYAALDDCQIGVGRCTHDEGAIPYRPWVEALTPLLATLNDNEVAVAVGSAARELGELFPDLRHRLSAAASTPAPATVRTRAHLFEGIGRTLRALAKRSPAVVALEDLHDADASSIALLSAVARSVVGEHILLVLTVRSTDDLALRRVTSALAGANVMANIELRGLSDEEIKDFAGRVVGGELSAHARATVAREAAGNALYAREFARLIAASGPHADLAALQIPVTVQRMVQDRLEALSEECVDALEVASVIGYRFETPLVGRVLELPLGRLMDTLGAASSAGVVRPADEQLRTFDFTHDVLRKTLYTQLTLARRAELHRAIAEAIESVAIRGERIEELAYHYGAAVASGGDVEKAVGYAIRAGERARAKCAWDEAVAHWERALHLMDELRADPDEVAALLERLAELLFSTGGDYAAALRHLERALGLRDLLGQEERAAQIHSRLGVALSTHIGEARLARYMDVPRALRHYRAAEAVLSQGAERPALGYFYGGLASAAFNAVRIDEGLEASTKAMRLAERLRLDSLLSSATLLHGALLKAKGRLAESRELLSGAYRIADGRNDPLVTYYTTTNIADWTEGYVAGRGQLYRRELEKPRFASAEAQRTGLLQDLGCALCRGGRLEEARALGVPADGFLAAMLLFCDGDWDAAERIWREGFDLLAAVGHRSAYANQCHQLAALYIAKGVGRAAERLLREELDIGTEAGGVLIELRARVELALICADGDRRDEAREHVRIARSIVSLGEDWGSRAARLEMAEGLLTAASGDLSRAADHVEIARAWFEAAELPWDEAELNWRWARSLARRGSAAEARLRIRAAQRIYRRIGAGAPWGDLARRYPSSSGLSFELH